MKRKQYYQHIEIGRDGVPMVAGMEMAAEKKASLAAKKSVLAVEKKAT